MKELGGYAICPSWQTLFFHRSSTGQHQNVIPLEFPLTLKSRSFEFSKGGLADRKEQKNNYWEVTWKTKYGKSTGSWEQP